MSTTQSIDYSVNLTQVLLWHYNQATDLTGIINAKQSWYDFNQESFWSEWQENVFDLSTANNFGCIVWAIILGFPLGPFIQSTVSYLSFGFNQFHSNFNNSNFAPTTGPTLNLTNAQQILVLRLRLYKLIGKATKSNVNPILAALFGTGNIYLIDNHNMTCTVVYNSSAISGSLLNVLENYDIIPRGNCVTFTFAED
jgi:hypothetical protein